MVLAPREVSLVPKWVRGEELDGHYILEDGITKCLEALVVAVFLCGRRGTCFQEQVQWYIRQRCVREESISHGRGRAGVLQVPDDRRSPLRVLHLVRRDERDQREFLQK